MDRSPELLKGAGVAILSVLVGILASTGNEVVLVSLLVVLIGGLVMWKPNQGNDNKDQLLREGAVKTSKQAQLAAQVMKEKFTKSEAVEADLQCSSLESARPYLRTKCDMYSDKKPISQGNDNKDQLLREGAVKTSKQAQLAAQLLKEKFTKSEAVEAALQCSSLESARAYLRTKCDMCSAKKPISQMVSMIMCEHNICQTCGKDHFTRKISLGNKYDCVCPFCGQPEITDDDQAFQYFSTMDALFKNLLDEGVYDDLQNLLMNSDQNRGGSKQVVSNFVSCALCEKVYKEEELLRMLRCQHEFCGECLVKHFGEKLSSACLKDCVCPTCKRPDLNQEEDAILYFQELYVFLQPIIDNKFLKNYQPLVFYYEMVKREMILCRSQNIECTFEQMELAIELMEQGFDRDKSIRAAKECSDMEFALQYLQRECKICLETFPEDEMISMLACSHSCCVRCAKAHFTVKVSEEPVTSLVCPFCGEPNMDGDTFEYLSRMETLLKHVLDPLVHDLFVRKIRDEALNETPNFRWCCTCQFGFLVEENELRVTCPDCNNAMCSQCKRPWADQHEGISCEMFTEWLEENDPDNQAQALRNYLRENGINCPNCDHHFALARGGCPHYTCTQCLHEFCFYCREPYSRTQHVLQCTHDRNCGIFLLYLPPSRLQEFLRGNNVPFRTEVPEGQPQTTRCPVPLTHGSWRDFICDGQVNEGHAGLCENHYREYLIKVISEHNLEIQSLR